MLLTQRFQCLRATLWRMMKRNLPSRDLQRFPTLATVGLPAVSSTLDTLRSARSTRQHARRPRSAPRAHSVRLPRCAQNCKASVPLDLPCEQSHFCRSAAASLCTGLPLASCFPPTLATAAAGADAATAASAPSPFWETQRLPDLVFCKPILHSNGFDHTPRAWWSLGSSGPFFQREPNLPRQSRHVELRRVQGEPFRVPELLVDPTLHSQAISA